MTHQDFRLKGRASVLKRLTSVARLRGEIAPVQLSNVQNVSLNYFLNATRLKKKHLGILSTVIKCV